MKKTRSLHHQILFVNCTIGLLLVIMFFSSFYFLNWKTEQDTKNATIQALDTIMRNFESETMRLNTLTDLCRNDPSFVLSSANRFDLEDFVSSSMEASYKLDLLRYSLPYAENVFIYVTNNEQVIRMNKSVIPVELFLPSLEKKLVEGEAIPDFSQISNGFHIYENFALYCKWIQNYGCLTIEINTSNFCNLNEIGEGLQSDIIIMDASENLFATTNRSLTGIVDAIGDSNEPWQTVKHDGKSYQVIQSIMPRTDYRFIMVSHNIMLQESKRLVILFAILSIVLLSAACALLVLLNQRIYNPLRSIMKKLNNTDSNELVAISNRFEQLVNENSLMSEQLVSQREISEDFAISYIFNSNGMPEADVLDTLRNKYDSYYVVAIAAQDNNGHCPELLAEADSYLTDTLNSRTARIDRFCHAYLIPVEDVEEKAILLILEKYFSSLELSDDVHTFVGISDKACDIETLYSVYRQAHSRMMNCTISESRHFELCWETDTDKGVYKTISLELQNTIAQTVLNGTSQDIETLLRRIFYIESGQTLGGFTSIYQNVCSLLSVLFANLPDADVHEWKTQRNRPVYCPAYMFNALLYDCEMAKQLSNSGQQASRYQIIDYIKENYTKPLSLDSIAEEFGITSVYLSTWFKKNVGVNLSVYLSNFRMEKAKELLRTERGIKVAELANKVGISSASTFNRNFKNHTGVTPDQYRKLLDISNGAKTDETESAITN